jgi:pimeloyl-ACP methyl ester carboxylesterase
MINVNLALLHGFWSSPATWEELVECVREDPQLRGVKAHSFGYESPKLRLPFSPTRIPQYDDIAHTLPAWLRTQVPDGDVAVVTHSQGGLVLQRFLAWMLTEGRGRELARIRLIVMLVCPHEGSEYLRSIRAIIGLHRNPQASELSTLNADAAQARRIVLERVVNASGIDDHECRIPIYVYAGRTDNIVSRVSAQSVFPHAASLPGNHFSILHARAPGNLTFQTLKKHLIETFTLPPETTQRASPQTKNTATESKYSVSITDSVGAQVGDHNVQHNDFRARRNERY